MDDVSDEVDVSVGTFVKYLEDYIIEHYDVKAEAAKAKKDKTPIPTHYIEALSEILHNNIFIGISYHNIKQYLSSDIMKKLNVEYGTKRFFKNEFRVGMHGLW